MPDHPVPDYHTPEPESPAASVSAHLSSPEHLIPAVPASSASGSDLAGLAALFVSRGGDGLSAELSADLALEIVLNEIVEQACLSTSASGAAIALLRDGEMVCRASSGANTPELGARLESETGLTAECLRTKQVQVCADAQSDPRANMEASRSLGVRSVMIFPLLRGDEVLGVLEVFSTQPGVFRSRDEATLAVLAHRILKNLEQARAPLSTLPTASPNFQTLTKDTRQDPDPFRSGFAEEENRNSSEVVRETANEMRYSPPNYERRARPKRDIVTVALGAALVLCAVLLGTLIGIGLGWRKSVATRARMGKSVSTPEENNNVPQNTAQESAGLSDRAPAVDSSPASTLAANSTALPSTPNAVSPSARGATLETHPKASPPPAGSLLVYENGKEIFRMPPARSKVQPRTAAKNGFTSRSDAPPASALRTAGIVELSPQVAEGRLIYRVAPEYPEPARQQRIQGPVVLDLHIGRDGAIQEVTLVNGAPLLADAAIAAVKQWRFKPRILDGHPVEMQTRVTLNFRLPG
jgi:TonB family protein